LTDAERDELEDLDPRYLFAAEWLARQDIGLAIPKDDLTAYEERVILYVHAERQHLRQQRSEEGADDSPEGRQFREDAEPQELEVSDAELLRQAGGAHRGRNH